MDMNLTRKLSKSSASAESRLTLAGLRPAGIKVFPPGPQGALEDMIRNAPGSIALFDEFNRHLEVSDEYCAQLHLSRLAILGKEFPELLNELPHGLLRALEMTLAGEALLLEMQWSFGDARTSVSYSVRLHPWRKSRKVIGGSILFLNPLAKPTVAQLTAPLQISGLLEAAPGFMAITDSRGRISFMNATGRAMLGLSSLLEAQKYEMASFCWKSATTHVHSLPPNRPWMGEMLLHNPQTGQPFPMMMMAFSVTGGDGMRTASAYYGTEIQGSGASKQQPASDEPQVGLKLETVCRATREIAHDLNNVLLVIMGYASLLKEEMSFDARLAPKAEAIHRAGERGAELAGQLLAISQKHATNDPSGSGGSSTPA
jgi:PAS domain-containing protein